MAAIQDRPFDVAAEVDRLRAILRREALGPSTHSIVEAVRCRGIPSRRLNEGSLVQLGHGSARRMILASETDRTGAVAEGIAQDKELTRKLVAEIGMLVPEGRQVQDEEDARVATQEVRPPVVVKPQHGNQGRGVATDLWTREQVLAAYQATRREGTLIIVDRFIRGDDHRILVVDGRTVAASLRQPGQGVGNGRSTVAQLVDEANRDPRWSDGHTTALSRIYLDDIAFGVLAAQGLAADSVPPAGAPVFIRRNANLSAGNTAVDVTESVHPEVAERAIEATRIVGLDAVGVDVVATDVGRPLEEPGDAIVEVNAEPGLRMHLEPTAGTPREVGNAIVDLMFEAGQTFRIPIVGVTGVNGKTTVTRLIAHLFPQMGRVVGLTCTDGVYVDGYRIESGDCSGPSALGWFRGTQRWMRPYWRGLGRYPPGRSGL